jgi:16S rRNA (cytidine1402-2'-O)-methyltransferase
MENKGRLFVVSTPIGNLEDITLRALRILKEVDFILSENPRKTLRLLNHYEIRKPVFPFFQRTDEKRIVAYLERVKNGERCALVVEAGTPGISDPGEEVIKRAIDMGIEIIPVPGPSALTTALSVAGAPTGKGFIFLGFPPHKKKRKEFFKNLKNYDKTIVIYESPYRLKKTLKEIAEVDENFNVALMKEMTKIYEKFYRGRAGDIAKIFDQMEDIKGEWTIVLWRG